VVALVVASTACVVLAAATFLSRQELADTQSDLEASQEQVATLEETRARLVGELAATKGISQKRATVLLRANNVLGGLDPLLASVDALKKDTSDIQAGRSAFQTAANDLIQTTITLVNYLVDTDSAYADNGYTNDLIDQANGELDTVNSYGSQLSQSDATYSKDAASFDTRATSLSSSVAALKKQLTQVTR
jgi:chromosome segregation ATPase